MIHIIEAVLDNFHFFSECLLSTLSKLIYTTNKTDAVSPFVDEGQNKKDNKGKSKNLFHDPKFTRPTKQTKEQSLQWI